MPEAPSGREQGALITLGRQRTAPFALVYHELVDLYADHIYGFAGLGYWLYLRRYVNNDPGNEWNGRAFPQKSELRRRAQMGWDRLYAIERACLAWGLLEIETVSVPVRREGILVGVTRRLLYSVNDPLAIDEFRSATAGGLLPRDVLRAESEGTSRSRDVPGHITAVGTCAHPRRGDVNIKNNNSGSNDLLKNNNKAADPVSPGEVVVPWASPFDPEVEQVLALMATLAPDVPASAAEEWLREHGALKVAEHLDWLKTEIGAGRRVDSRGGWLRDSFGWSEPPASYLRLQRERERQVRREAVRQADVARAEEAAAVAEEDRRRLQDAQTAYFALALGRQAEIDSAARAAVATGPAGRMVDVPPVPDAWEARTVGAVLWREAIGVILRRDSGVIGWDAPAPAVTGSASVSGSNMAATVADPPVPDRTARRSHPRSGGLVHDR